MPLTFDSPRKNNIRNNWNTPLLKVFSRINNIKYLYLGLPGAEILDIKVWRDMIEHVIVFESKSRKGDPRSELATLQRNLALLGVTSDAYYGDLENTIILGKDLDGKKFQPKELVTLYNLDFCNAITAKISTIHGNECWRFEAIRSLMRIQKELYVRANISKFIILLTVRDNFHLEPMNDFLENKSFNDEEKNYIDLVLRIKPLGTQPIQNNTPLLKLFVFRTLRHYLGGNHISSFFFTVIKYFGRTSSSKMLHFTILCRLEPVNLPLPRDFQTTKDFLELTTFRANNNNFELEPLCSFETNSSINREAINYIR